MIDGDFKTNKECKYHCSHSCYPGQIDDDKWHYGCLHKAYPSNKYGEFCPFVECGGIIKKCELKGSKILSRYIGGKRKSYNYQKSKLDKIKQDLDFAVKLNSQS